MLACAGPAAARDATVTSLDGTPIATHLYPAQGLAPGGKAPTVLVGHGWGGQGDTDPNSASSATTGNTGLGPLRKAGFNVLTSDARGFGNKVLGNQVTPIPVLLDGKQHVVERRLEPIAAHATPSSRYAVQVLAGTTVYGVQRSTGAVTLDRVEAALPVRVPVGADGQAVRQARLVASKPKGLRRGRRGQPVRVIVRARNAKVRRVRVVLRRKGGKVVGRSRRFVVGAGQRKIARVRVKHQLRRGSYVVRASGRAADGSIVRAPRRIGALRGPYPR